MQGTTLDYVTMERAPVNGGELEYEIRGDGEAVLFIHGAHIADAFLPLGAEAPLADYRLIRYHRRGYAGSTAPAGPPETYIERAAADAAALLQHLDVQRAHIVGHSSGGLIALQLALDAPEAVLSLMLLEPALLMVPSYPAFADALMPVVERYFAGDEAGAVDGFMRAVAGPAWQTEIARTVPGGPEQAEQDAATFFELELQAVGAWTLDVEKEKKISQPILYVLGSESLTFLKEGRDLLVHAWFPQTEDYVVQGVNHALQMQDPRSVAEGIADFMSRHRS